MDTVDDQIGADALVGVDQGADRVDAHPAIEGAGGGADAPLEAIGDHARPSAH
jgi:hypothetical protein